mmetsp:Transcript_8044/g.16405  ORF Transcript_8044/g.16405 Transcript_8044/m.16405 type:complete len:584 (+) Transcript_8044:52-1803(+)
MQGNAPFFFVTVAIAFNYDRLLISSSLDQHHEKKDGRQEDEARISQKDIDICSLFNTDKSPIWSDLKKDILAASYWPMDQANNSNFTQWIDGLFVEYYNVHQLRRSSFYPADAAASKVLIEVVSDRMKYLNGQLRSYSPPMHILVTGGSVTFGMNCAQNPVGIPEESLNKKFIDCAWPARLENLFNRGLFQNKKVVKVTNLATGGASTDVSNVVLEYHLIPEEVKNELPHIVIWAHAPNDAQAPDKGVILRKHIPEFIIAASNLRMCDDLLPLVVILEDFYGYENYETVNQLSGYLYELATWYGLMGINHANVIKHELWANLDKAHIISNILGGDYSLHPGMGSHIGVAWTVFYNFLVAFSDSCADSASGERITKNPMNSKYMGGYEIGGKYQSIRSTWQRNKNVALDFCSDQLNSNTAAPSPCTYAFMASTMSGGVVRPSDLIKKMSRILTANVGWEAAGNPIKQPRTGWYATKPHASFSLRIVASLETKYMTIMAMKSYGDRFLNTLLEINVRIQHIDKNRGESIASYEITGYHKFRTSIHSPQKFELPGGGAKVNDTIIVNATLSRGAYFKINGFAFCQY